MWTLPDNFTSDGWTPRSVVTAAETVAVAERPSSPVMRAVLDALKPFAEARRAVAEAMARAVGPYPGLRSG